MSQDTVTTPKSKDGKEPGQASIWDEFRLATLLPTLTAGMITGILTVIVAISFAVLIFSGDLSETPGIHFLRDGESPRGPGPGTGRG